MTDLQTAVGLTSLFAGALALALICSLRPATIGPVACAFLLRACAAMWHEFVSPLPLSGADAVVFEDTARVWALGFGQQLPSITDSGAFLYSLMASRLYAWVMPSRLLLESLNVFGGSLTVAVCQQTVTRLWGKQSGRISAFVVAFNPTCILYSAITMREVAVSLPLSCALYFIVRWGARLELRFLIAALGFSGLGLAFHTALGGAVAALMLLAGTTALGELHRREVGVGLRHLSLCLLALVAGGVAVAAGFGLSKVGAVQDLSIDTVSAWRDTAIRGGATYLQGLQVNSWLDLVWQLPIRAIYFLFTPFPWMVRGGADLIAFADAVFWVFLGWMVLRQLNRWIADRRARAVFVVLCFLVCTFGVGVSNFGTALRHRSKLLPAIVLLIPQWSLLGRRQHKRDYATSAARSE